MKILQFLQTRKFNWYIILWITSATVAVFLFFRWQIEKNFLGIVERRTHPISAQESGRIQTLLVEPGDKVAKDQLLAVLYLTDLKTNLENLQGELNRLRNLEEARRNNYSMQIERLRLRLDNEASDLVERLAMIESKSAELASLNALIQRLQTAQDAGLGYNRDLAELNIQRDALVAYLNKLRQQLPDLTSPEKISESTRSLQSSDLDEMSKALLTEDLEHAEELRREIVDTEHRINMRTLVAPCDGYVTQIFANSGDVTKAFDPVLTIEETYPSRLTVYIPEHSSIQPVIGSQVRIFSSRNKQFATTGTVSFIHPGYTRADERISFRGQVFWARKVLVDLGQNNQLVPGEVVTVRMSNKGKLIPNHNAGLAVAESTALLKKNDSDQPPVPIDMEIPQKLRSATNFEPSGVAWCPELGKFLLVSDDTGIKNTKTEHAPLIFNMNAQGQVDSRTQNLAGITLVNDLEGITAAGNGTYYLISSQNISKNGKRPTNREYLIKIECQNDELVVRDKVDFLTLILKSYPSAILKELGLAVLESDQRPELNIEGIAYDGEALYFGLKQPLSPNGAIIWKLTNLQQMFSTKRLEEGQLTLFGTVNLKRPNGKAAGISDLCFDPNGKLWVLSTIPGADQKEQIGALHRINHFTDGRLEAKTIFYFPELKPEGLCFQDRTHLLIVFDKDNEIPSYCFVNPEQL